MVNCPSVSRARANHVFRRNAKSCRRVIIDAKQIWNAFSILEMLVRHFHQKGVTFPEPDRSFGAPRPKTLFLSLFTKGHPSEKVRVRSGRKLENAKSARFKRMSYKESAPCSERLRRLRSRISER